MQRIHDFLKLRKQNDTVKIICVLILIGVICLLRVLYYAGQIYRFVNTPVEYTLIGASTVNDEKLRELEQEKNVAAVSREMEIPVSIKYNGKTTSTFCVLLSRSYLERAYHVNVTGNGKVIYMNAAAAENLRLALLDQGIYTSLQSSADNTEYDIRYAEEGSDTPGSYRSARLVIIEDSLHDTLPFTCMVDAGTRLSKESTELRILLKQHDLDGMQTNGLQNSGYAIENENDMIKEGYELRIWMLHIGYEILIWGICTLSATVLWHQVKKDISRQMLIQDGCRWWKLLPPNFPDYQ